MPDDQLVMRLYPEVLDDLHAPPQAQACRACGVFVQTYEEWLVDKCNLPACHCGTKHLGHDVPGYLRLPFGEDIGS